MVTDTPFLNPEILVSYLRFMGIKIKIPNNDSAPPRLCENLFWNHVVFLQTRTPLREEFFNISGAVSGPLADLSP